MSDIKLGDIITFRGSTRYAVVAFIDTGYSSNDYWGLFKNSKEEAIETHRINVLLPKKEGIMQSEMTCLSGGGAIKVGSIEPSKITNWRERIK